ncbi:MAG TPA: NUDIX domain-containing protein [Intrasporangium sp.]|uniref:NUDIX domain-containing protein n=1 Tax=Intrasporangium sp. TaxID=1925024 RepID=UPI002B461C39|nr:NUDIX domain-containing protein [Intrasporangium sp.]HKX66064.1 NUDIX domain-containing protein [Intrasporangium sp.]
MRDEGPVQRTALGATCAIFDGEGRVLLVHHTYGLLNWELPGGGAEPGEAPDETARRELLEETGLRAELDRLTGVYLEPHHDFGPMLHFVFRCRWNERLDPVAASPEVSDVRYWPLDDLPTPISDFTERRIQDAILDGPVRVGRVNSRQWRG